MRSSSLEIDIFPLFACGRCECGKSLPDDFAAVAAEDPAQRWINFEVYQFAAKKRDAVHRLIENGPELSLASAHVIFCGAGAKKGIQRGNKNRRLDRMC